MQSWQANCKSQCIILPALTLAFLTGGKMNLRRLKYFVKIVDIGSLTQAAEVLHIAQPALSQQVATPEGEMDQQLLIRTKRGVTPTEAGKILYTHARTILRQCEQAQLAVNNVGQTLRGQVSIGWRRAPRPPPLPCRCCKRCAMSCPR